MSTTDALADPLAAALACVLTAPVIELYAVLWRAGVVEVEQAQADQTRSADQTAAGSRRPTRRLPLRLLPAPAPRRRAPAAYSRAVG
ncbi:Rv1535 domain-containing protein [Mycobacterium sp.]|uniref:Rv1535 domain-containing protein n=1 Tax=Mycobacterium sp. TaxID=1785 RepID=UPI003D6B54CD